MEIVAKSKINTRRVLQFKDLLPDETFVTMLYGNGVFIRTDRDECCVSFANGKICEFGRETNVIRVRVSATYIEDPDQNSKDDEVPDDAS